MSHNNQDQSNKDVPKKPGMGDQMGQKAQPKDGQQAHQRDLDKNKSNDMNKGNKPGQGQATRQS